MFFDASLASSAFPSEKQGAPRGIPLSVLSKEKVRQGCSLVFLGRSRCLIFVFRVPTLRIPLDFTGSVFISGKIR